MGSQRELVDNPLHEAVRFSDVELVRDALADGWDPNIVGLYHWSALHEAAHNGDVGITKLLLKHKGHPNAPDLLQGCTAVHYASREGHTECLDLLVKAGGRYDVKNNNGESCLDVAHKDCEDILEAQYAKDVIAQRKAFKSSPNKPTEFLDHYGTFELHKPPSKKHTIAKKLEKDVPKAKSEMTRHQDNEDKPIVCEPSKTLAASPSAWSPTNSEDDIQNLSPQGRLQLSFEYNAKKSVVKIRVWQLADIILPPVESSMIGAVYVKTFLVPDAKKDSKRKTEEIRVDRVTVISDKKTGHSVQYSTRRSFQVQQAHIQLKPITLKFTKALEYTNVTNSVLNEKTLEMQVCVTHKYSRKCYIVASCSLPLKDAVKKLVREYFQLKAYTIIRVPENLKLYGADYISVSTTYRNYYSNPNLRNPSMANLQRDATERAVSDSDLKRVHVDKMEKVPSIVISMPTEESVHNPDFSLVIHNDGSSQSNPDLTAICIPGSMAEDGISAVIVEKKAGADLRKAVSTPELSTDESDQSELDASVNSQKGSFLTTLARQKMDALSMIEKGRNKKGHMSHSKEVVQLINDPHNQELNSHGTGALALKDMAKPRKHGRVSPGVVETSQWDDYEELITLPDRPNTNRLGKSKVEKAKSRRKLPTPKETILDGGIQTPKEGRLHSALQRPGKAVIQYEDDLTGGTVPDSVITSRRGSLQSFQPKPVNDYSVVKTPSPRTRRNHKRSNTSPGNNNAHLHLEGESSLGQKPDDTVVCMLNNNNLSKVNIRRKLDTAPVHGLGNDSENSGTAKNSGMEYPHELDEYMSPFAVPESMNIHGRKQVTSL